MHFYARHGVMPQETTTGNAFIVNVTMEVDFSAACLSDDVRDTVNYAEVFDLIREEMEIPSQLLEHLAGRIGHRLKQHYPQLTSLELSVAKCRPPVNGVMERAEVVIIL